MKRSFLILMAISIVITAGFSLAVKATNYTDPNIVFTSKLPSDLATTDDKAENFNPFSWQSFVALNWPTDENGNPIEPENQSTIGLYPDAPRVWQCYEHPEEVFQQDGQTSTELHKKCEKTIRLALSKEGEEADEREGNDRPKEVKLPLIDQQKNYVVYEIRVNPDEAKQIRDNGWNEIKKLEKYDTLDQCKEKENKKENCNLFQFSTSDGARPIEIKAAWRVFDASTSSLEKARYYTTKQTLHIPAKYSTTGQDIEEEVELGLIGFHIAQKTANKNWIWSTFEQVDNLEVNVPPISPSLKPTLRNLDCNVNNKCLPDNTRDKNETYFWRKESPHAVTKEQNGEMKELEPTQVQRLDHRGPSLSTKKLNEQWRKKFQEINSVLQYYQLIGTEWMFGLPCGLFSNNTNNCAGIPVSQFFNSPTNFIFSPVANVTMETYTEPQNSSCVKCHAGARLTQDRKRSTDFSFLLDEYAK
ncbi:hypothetical protein [Oscillatoria sp. FACHB-1406]|uniref:hypothetical protein n=1 Tax=Oscillatoria sp. FACHB-1406 TaxID=2692846 RepID=UPI00198E922E|nr:hypothetical protein [Oscillatoria sp. FACHB-1406]MBD2579326.1 hypothetical protein [Oscillatoria sp. FACHB-1406]